LFKHDIQDTSTRISLHTNISLCFIIFEFSLTDCR